MTFDRLTLLLSAVLLTSCISQAALTESGAEFQTSSMESSVSSETPPVMSATERAQSGGLLQIGNADAKVSMLLFINHSSEYSRQFHRNLLPRLMTDFVSQGTLQIGIIPMQFAKYPESKTIAGMLLCATAQGKGQAMNNLLFSQANAATLQKEISTIGLDLPKLQECMSSEDLAWKMDDAARLMQSFSVTLAPTYTINGAVHTGLPEYADLRAQVQQAMK